MFENNKYSIKKQLNRSNLSTSKSLFTFLTITETFSDNKDFTFFYENNVFFGTDYNGYDSIEPFRFPSQELEIFIFICLTSQKFLDSI